MEFFGDFAGQAVAERLGRPAANGYGDPIGRAVLAALFDPDPAQDADTRASATPASTLTVPQPGTPSSPPAEMPSSPTRP